MALTSVDFGTAILKYKLIQETDLSSVAIEDVTKSVAGKLYSIEVKNNRTTVVYAKITLTVPTVTVGGGSGTPPEIMIHVAASGQSLWSMPDGIDFTTLSFWGVQGNADDNAAAPTGGSGCEIRVVTS